MGKPATFDAARRRMSNSEETCCACNVARSVLEILLQHWPMQRDLFPEDVGLGEDAHRHRFVQTMQALLDQGFVTFEGADSPFGQPCFRDALITPSGRTALRVMRFMATLP